jgi:predicted nucleotidyltransferase
MKNQLKILRFFIEHRNQAFAVKKVAEALEINYRIAYDEIRSLEKEQLIKTTKLGNSNQCIFSYQFHEKIVAVEEIRKEELFKNSNLKLLYKRIKEIKNPFYILLIFGSYASRTQNRNSDIDLCLIADSKKIKEQFHQILSITPVDVHAVDFTSEEFMGMLSSSKPNVGHEIVRNNIILSGIESFYELVSYVRQ